MTKFISVAFWIAIWPLVFVIEVRGVATCKKGTADETCAPISSSPKLPEEIIMGCSRKSGEAKGCQATRKDPDDISPAPVCAPSFDGAMNCVCFTDGCNANDINGPAEEHSVGTCPPEETKTSGGTILEALTFKGLLLFVSIGMIAAT